MSPVAEITRLWRTGARALAEMVRTRQVSSREVVEAHLRRIDEVNPTVNAITAVQQEQSLAAAREADRVTMTTTDRLPPLHGVPFTVKENIDLVGTATTQGVRALAEALPTRDAPVVERLRLAGGIPIGRTNMPSCGVGWDCVSELHGATLNPWDPTRTPGASSGGEAVALATGMSPLGVGNDGLGSLRWPAHCCGIASLRPTLGRIPHASSLDPADVPISGQLLEVEGPMARHIADLRTALEVLAGPTWRDPWSVPAPLRGPQPDRPIQVALVTEPAGRNVAPHVADGLRRAADALDAAGYAVEEIEPPAIELAARAALDMLAVDLRAAWDLFASWPEDSRRILAALLEIAGSADALTGVAAYMTRSSLLRAWSQFQETRHLIVAPISTEPPFAAGIHQTTDVVADIVHGLATTIAVNALGLPAVALPVGVRDGLPQTVQIIGPRYREDLCLDAAQHLEDHLGVITPIDPRPARPQHEATRR